MTGAIDFYLPTAKTSSSDILMLGLILNFENSKEEWSVY